MTRSRRGGDDITGVRGEVFGHVDDAAVERDLDADIVFHEFVSRRPSAAHDKYANQEVAYRAAGHDDGAGGLGGDSVGVADSVVADVQCLPEVGDEVLVSLLGNEGVAHQAAATAEFDDASLGPVGLEIDELDDLNL